ncbi:ATP-dependent DNA helicase RecG [Microbaculum marinum]|uniref:ATP-dependent DNA helicase RecG n=1 Tax=Microbaculum marinum TaxID=1764581 RepID=A0AAW9RWD0_9HYPH
MRPSDLNALFAPVSSLPGVGPRLSKLFARLLGADEENGEALVVDLLWHLPAGLVDRRERPTIDRAVPGTIATLNVVVDRHRPSPPGRSRAPYRVQCHDETGELTLVFFHANAKWIESQLPVGAVRWVSGRLEEFGGALQIVHPDHIVDQDGFARLPLLEPIYAQTAGLGGRTIAKAAAAAIEVVPSVAEWQDPDWLKRNGWTGFKHALETVHRPAEPAEMAEDGPSWKRLAYDELLAGQLALTIVRSRLKRAGGITRTGDGAIRGRIVGALAFSLTMSQMAAVDEILSDLADPTRMLRLLQGDVGSGKTVVGLLAMAAVAESGAQSALMAPTELLARQHFRTIAPLAEAAGLKVAILTGREQGKERAPILAGVADGSTDILVGTHALFQAGVDFSDLGLAVVDEQHRFGVHQRLSLAAKGKAVDMLVMTATPIPRTLLLTHFGDMDVTRLTEKPAGRRPIATRVLPIERLSDVVAAVRRAVDEGAQVYWVCPLVEESEELDVISAEERFAALKPAFGDAVAVIHGRMSGAEKDKVMRRFIEGAVRVLVATTVIEVGVDVPDATVMIIEHAERFGLAQLHQLRGRVGRGQAESSCLLLYKGPLGETGRSRLEIMRETEDGFRIAEEDLRLRGGGEVLGTRQSGMPEFRVVRTGVHLDMLEAARDDARLALERDPRLHGERGKALRTLLYLFRKDAAMRLIEAG